MDPYREIIRKILSGEISTREELSYDKEALVHRE